MLRKIGVLHEKMLETSYDDIGKSIYIFINFKWI